MSYETVLVFGASGFIGRQCVIQLLGREDVGHVIGVSRTAPAWAEAFDARLSWYSADLLDPPSIRKLLAEAKASHAIHLGWYVGEESIWTTLNNVDWSAATLMIVRQFVSSGGRRIIVAGTCAEYTGSGTFREDQISRPETLYGVAKSATHELTEAFFAVTGTSFAWARLFHMYGPHENARRLVAGAATSLLRGQAYPCSDGQQVRDFLHCADVGGALVALLCSTVEGAINLGSGQPVTLQQLLQAIAVEVGRPDLLRFGERTRALNDPDMLLPDLTRQHRELGWAPQFNLEAGMRNTVSWWRRQVGS